MPWLSVPLTVNSKCWAMAQMAASLMDQSCVHEAIVLSEQSCALASNHDDPKHNLHARNSLATKLMEAGRPNEAAEMMVVSENYSPGNRFWITRNLTEAHLAAGNLSEAHDWLSRSLTYHKQLKIPYFDSQLDEWAKAF